MIDFTNAKVIRVQYTIEYQAPQLDLYFVFPSYIRVTGLANMSIFLNELFQKVKFSAFLSIFGRF